MLTLNFKTDPDMVLYFNCKNRRVTRENKEDYTPYITLPVYALVSMQTMN
jgi:hypothetical protein